ncbi:ABC transporter substrate-binding protein [Luteolibacter pohnpeiensis]|uniref:ABC transporter substrate-binding protein n=1 Tax=Luteolibacter pohnpeiensis TaxID=454153 RepID=A0A934S7W5_9BACT|nr:ABC transporter substrate-binding protein [Luteolibacter pohnpeiensis]
MPLSDCAPMAVAKEMGIFRKHHLKVRLSRELGWATVRDKIFYGDLDGAQCISGIAFSLAMGAGNVRRKVAVPMVLNLHGNAITLSMDLDPVLIGTGEGLLSYLTHSWKKDRPFTMAAPHRFSSHHILLNTWLQRQGITSPDLVEIIFLPPPLMPRHLKAGHIDGYCVGEPWNSASILTGEAWCPAVSADISHGHPEKVLLLDGGFTDSRREDAVALTAALLEACKLCDEPDFRSEMIQILARKEYTGAPVEVLANSMGQPFNSGGGTKNMTPFHLFHGPQVNPPTLDKASWTLAGLRSLGLVPKGTSAILSEIYRNDLYEEAIAAGAPA